MIFLQWLGKQESFLDDLQSLDPDLWQGLVNLKHCADNPQDLNVNFTIAVDGEPLAFPPPHRALTYIPSENETHDLIPNGSNVAVTRENRLQYIQLVSHYRLSEQIKLQSEAFFEGLLEVIDSRLFR
jgi:ubiquitin-protein ligase E3 C